MSFCVLPFVLGTDFQNKAWRGGSWCEASWYFVWGKFLEPTCVNAGSHDGIAFSSQCFIGSLKYLEVVRLTHSAVPVRSMLCPNLRFFYWVLANFPTQDGHLPSSEHWGARRARSSMRFWTHSRSSPTRRGGACLRSASAAFRLRTPGLLHVSTNGGDLSNLLDNPVHLFKNTAPPSLIRKTRSHFLNRGSLKSGGSKIGSPGKSFETKKSPKKVAYKIVY